jgi:hypothetical protein
MSENLAKKLYTVENRFPKLLSSNNSDPFSDVAGIVHNSGKDFLVLAGYAN